MDYTELLFAAQVRRMALTVIDANIPSHLSTEERTAHALAEFPRVAANIVRDLKEIAKMVKDIP